MLSHQLRRAWIVSCCSAAIALFASPAVALEIAPTFAIRTLEGKSIRTSDFKGQPVVLDFWATWCTPCRASIQHLDQLQSRYRDRGLVVIGLSVDDSSPVAVRRYATQLGLKFRLAMATEHVLDDYGPIRSIPTTFFINRRGEIVRRVVGYVDPETMESFAQEILTP